MDRYAPGQNIAHGDEADKATSGQGSEKKTIEYWHVARMAKATTPQEQLKVRTEHAAATALLGAAVGHEITEADYEQAIDDAMNARIG